jgi:hypothetical protein
MRAAMTAVIQHGVKGAPGCLIAEKGPVSCAGIEAKEAEGVARVRSAQQILRRAGTESLFQRMIGPGARLTCLMGSSSIACLPRQTQDHMYTSTCTLTHVPRCTTGQQCGGSEAVGPSAHDQEQLSDSCSTRGTFTTCRADLWDAVGFSMVFQEQM